MNSASLRWLLVSLDPDTLALDLVCTLCNRQVPLTLGLDDLSRITAQARAHIDFHHPNELAASHPEPDNGPPPPTDEDYHE